MRAAVFLRPALAVTAFMAFDSPALPTASSMASVKAPNDAALSGGVEAISCPSAGNCAAVGSTNLPGNVSFVVNETKGKWGRIQRVRGLAKLPIGGARQNNLGTVSCSSPGNCAAGGTFSDRMGGRQAFVVSERNGFWGIAQEVPGVKALNAGGSGVATVDSVACWSAGNCSAVGDYTDGNDHQQVFEVNSRHGRWGKAVEMPGTAKLNNGGDFAAALPANVSCGAPGDCATGGFYNSTKGTEAFVVSEKRGVWGKAEEVPGSAAVNIGAIASVSAVSCPSARD